MSVAHQPQPRRGLQCVTPLHGSHPLRARHVSKPGLCETAPVLTVGRTFPLTLACLRQRSCGLQMPPLEMPRASNGKNLVTWALKAVCLSCTGSGPVW